MAIDVGDHFLNVAVRLDRQQRTEELVLHDLELVARVIEQGRHDLVMGLACEILAGRVHFDQLDSRLARFGQVALQALKMARIDDRGVVRVVLEGREQLGNRGFSNGDEFRQFFFGHKHIVRCQADLPGVVQLAGNNLVNGGCKVGGAGDDGRRLATQFQGHGYQVFSSRAHHVLADAGGAGKQQMVERLAAKRLADIRPTGDDCHFIFGIHGAEDARDQRRGLRVELRDLDHHPVARRQCAGQAVEDQVAGEVPGREDTHHAQRLVLHPGFATVGVALFVTHPFGHFGLGVFHCSKRAQYIEQPREILAAMTEVGRQGRDDFLLVINQQADGAVDPLAALFGCPGFVGQAGGTLLVQNDANISSTQVFIGTHAVSSSIQWGRFGSCHSRGGPLHSVARTAIRVSLMTSDTRKGGTGTTTTKGRMHGRFST
ncbi:hypothetical protein D9M71_407270 [compost metagenome]